MASGTGSQSIFREQARTIAYDLPGHGGSLTFPDAGPAKTAAHAILADLAARGVDKAHLVGHSMGGAIAALMALADPDRVASLTLLAPGGFGEEINGPLLRRFATATSQDEIRQCHAEMSAQDARLSQHAVGALCEMRSRPGQTEMLVQIAAAITRDDRQGVIPRDKLAALSMPVSVVWGTKDPVLPFSQTREPAARLCPARGGECRPHADRGSAGPGDANHRARHTLTHDPKRKPVSGQAHCATKSRRAVQFSKMALSSDSNALSPNAELVC